MVLSMEDTEGQEYIFTTKLLWRAKLCYYNLMIFPEVVLRDSELTSYHQLADVLPRYLLGTVFSSISSEQADEMIRVNKFVPMVRNIIISHDPSTEPQKVETVGEALVHLTPRIIRYAKRNNETIPDLLELGHAVGIRRISVPGYEGLGLSLWKPDSYQTAPFVEWVPR
jgi:hypothetical protein